METSLYRVVSMALSTKALVVAVIAVIVCPILIYVELVAFLLADMITYEPGNPWFVKVGSVIALVLIGAAALALPVIALVLGTRAKRRIRLSETVVAGSGTAIAAQVIAGVVLTGVVLVQMYLTLWSQGVCSLDGCP